MKFLYWVNVHKSLPNFTLLHIHKILYDIKHNKIYYTFYVVYIRACLYTCIHTGKSLFPLQLIRMIRICPFSCSAASSKIYSNKSFRTLRGGRKKIPFFLILFAALPPFDCQQQSSFLSSSSCFVTIAIL
jgi:hypothetical protein